MHTNPEFEMRKRMLTPQTARKRAPMAGATLTPSIGHPRQKLPDTLGIGEKL